MAILSCSALGFDAESEVLKSVTSAPRSQPQVTAQHRVAGCVYLHVHLYDMTCIFFGTKPLHNSADHVLMPSATRRCHWP